MMRGWTRETAMAITLRVRIEIWCFTGWGSCWDGDSTMTSLHRRVIGARPRLACVAAPSAIYVWVRMRQMGAVRDNRGMPPRSRFALAMAVCIAAGVSALVLSIVSWNRGGLPIEELLLVEPVPADASTPQGDQLAFVAGLFDGTRRMTAQDSADRLGQDFAENFPPDVFNEITDSLVADTGGRGQTSARPEPAAEPRMHRPMAAEIEE